MDYALPVMLIVFAVGLGISIPALIFGPPPSPWRLYNDLKRQYAAEVERILNTRR